LKVELSPLDLAGILLTPFAVFGWLNHKFLPLHHSVGSLVGMAASLAIVAASHLSFRADPSISPGASEREPRWFVNCPQAMGLPRRVRWRLCATFQFPWPLHS
jgi:hypothetical protein